MSVKRLVYTALMTALIIAGAYLAIPVGPVPVVLQNFFILLTGLLLGSRWGLGSVCFYILLGLLGFPVFSKGGAGLAHLLGPTGGYLLGYIPAVFFIGLISERGSRHTGTRLTWLLDLAALCAGIIIIYTGGLLWLKGVTGMAWDKALAVGFLPFIGFDLVKLIAALFVAPLIRPLMQLDRPVTPLAGSDKV